MPIGEYRHRVTLRGQVGEEKDEEGIVNPVWGDVATVWATVEPVPTHWREYFAAAAIQAESYTRFRIRYRRDVTENMKVKYNGREYDIITVSDPDGRRRETHLMCRGVADSV